MRWEWIALGYVSYLAAVALARPEFARARRVTVPAAAMGWAWHAVVGIPVRSGVQADIVRAVVVPSIVLVLGYWLSRVFFVRPDVALERRLWSIDQRLLAREHRGGHGPRPVSLRRRFGPRRAGRVGCLELGVNGLRRHSVEHHGEGRVMLKEDRLAIEALHRAWLDAELRGESSSLLDFCTAAPVWLPPNEAPLRGRSDILRWLGSQPPAAILRIDIDELEISGIGPLASKLASFRTTVRAPGGAGVSVVTGSHAWLLQRDDPGAWHIGVVAWTIG